MRILFALILVVGSSALATDSSLPNLSSPRDSALSISGAKSRFALEDRRFWGMMGLGLDFRAERDQDQNVDLVKAPAISLGWGYKHFLSLLEYSSYEQAKAGNDTLSVQRQAETTMLWGNYFTDDEWKLRPYFAIGIGGFRESATTQFYNMVSNDKGVWNPIYGGAFGFRWVTLTPFWFTLEGRVLYSRDLDPNPTLGGLVKIGFVLE